jgi:hypothetical protein
MRQERSRKMPRSGGIVAASPRRLLGDGELAAVGVAALGDLRELLRVAEDDRVSRGRGGGESVGQTHLAGLVDDEDVELLIVFWRRERPDGSGEESEVEVGGVGLLAAFELRGRIEDAWQGQLRMEGVRAVG